MSKNILYIHGYNSSGNSNTVRNLRSFFENDNVYSETFPLLDLNETVRKITELIQKYNVNFLIGSSLGGFHTLAYSELPIKKIVINPCMFPSIEIPKLDSSLASDALEMLQQKESFVNSDKTSEIRQNVFGIFGLQDELFHYGDNFKKYYGNKDKLNQIFIDGKHRLTFEQLINGIKPAFQYFGE